MIRIKPISITTFSTIIKVETVLNDLRCKILKCRGIVIGR